MTDLLWKCERLTLRGRQRPRLEDVSLDITRGATAVMGYSGAGKTSLLNLLVQFERPDCGTILFHPAPAGDRLPVYWVPHENGLWPHLTVEEHVETVAPVGRIGNPSCTETLLKNFDLYEKRNAFPAELSQGEAARLAVVRALASEAEVLVMDEPLVHVDPARLGGYWQRIREHCEATQTSLVIATHSPEIALRETERAVCLHEGKLLYAGDLRELYFNPQSPQLAAFLGPANWLPPPEAADWIDHAQQNGCCYRPEQLAIVPSEESPLVVQSARFAGSVAEVELLNQHTRQTRRFFHRPAGPKLQPGHRVLIKALLAVVCALLFAGCEAGEEPRLPVKRETHWSMPADGRKIPAPRAITTGPDDEFYVLDDAGRVLVFDGRGSLLREWRMPAYDVGRPEGICILQDGRVAVADTHYHRVVFFDQTGNVLDMLGSYGTDPGEFIYPVAIVQDDAGNLYVCEYGENDRVQKFRPDGTFLLEFGSFGTGPGQFQRPSGIVWADGRLYTVDAFNNRIQVFSDSGEFLEILGDSRRAPPEGWSTGLHYPYDITGNPQDGFYVVEYGAGRVSKLDRRGRLLGRYGTTGTGEGEFITPWGLTIDSQERGGVRLLVADTGNRRITELEL